MSHRYVVCALSLESAVLLPGVRPVRGGPDWRAEVILERAPVPESWGATAVDSPAWEVAPDRFVLAIPGVGRLAALDGRVLRVAPLDGVPEAMLTPYALGTTFAALLYQRGEQLLHGSAVGFHGRVIVLCGPSGRGKSTLAAALCALGGRPVCDDLSRLVLGDRWSVFPDGRRLKLLPAAVAQLGLASHELATVSDGTGKRFVDLDGEGVGGEAEAAWGAGAEVSPWPIAGIVSIDVAEHPGRALLRRLDRVAAVTELLQRTYRRDLHAALVPGTEIARRAVSMAEAVPVYRLERPPGVERVMETAAVVLEGVLG